MASCEQLRKLLLNHYKPFIAIKSSNSAEQICKGIGLSTVQLLRPFANEENLNYSLKFENRSVELKSIAFNLEYIHQLKPMDAEDIEEELLDSLVRQEPSSDIIHSMIWDLANGKDAFNTDQPWLYDVADCLLNCCRFGESNLSFHPLAIFLIVSSTDPDPLLRFDELSQNVLHHDVFHRGMYTKSIPFFYLLLHDTASGVNEEDILRRMKSSFNASQCKVIRISSTLSLDPSNPHSSVLSETHQQNIKDIFQSIISRTILPMLQKNITSFTESVVADRRGFVNSVFSWLRSNSSSNILNTLHEDEPQMYSEDSIEFKIRFLADMAFLFQDYRSALDYYKMVVDDYRVNNSCFQLAEISYMIAFSTFLLEARTNPARIDFGDVRYHLNEAVQWLRSLQTPITRYFDSLVVVFSVLFHIALLVDLKRPLVFTEDIKLLASRTLDMDTISAVFLAWTGILQLETHQRRAMFSLVLASLRFKKLDFLSYALWTCLVAFASLKQANWIHIQTYCKAELLGLLAMQDPFDSEAFQLAQSIAFMDRSRENSENTGKDKEKDCKIISKEAPLQGFFQTLRQIPAGSSGEWPRELELCIPCLRSVIVRYEENWCEENLTKWPFLSDNREEDDRFGTIFNMIGRSHVDGNRIPQFHEGDGYSVRGEKQESIVMIGQRIIVETEVQNPLDEPLLCERIECVIQGEAETPAISCTILSLEKKTLQLFVIPKKEGILKITGIRFFLRDPSEENSSLVIPIQQSISLQGIRLHKTLEQRQRGIRGKDTALDIHVTPANHALSIKLGDLSEFHYLSELSKVGISLENRGNEAISEVVLLTPNYHWFPSQQNRILCESLFPAGNDADKIQCYSLLKEGAFLEKGESLCITSYIHYPETEGNEFIRNGYYELIGVFLFSNMAGNWKMIRFHSQIPMKRLLECKEQQIHDSRGSEGVSFYKTVIENVSEEQKIEGISITSSCPYCHINPNFPAVLKDVLPGTVHSIVTRLTAESEEKNTIKENSVFSNYFDFIDHFNPLELRLNRLSRYNKLFEWIDLVPKLANRIHRFVDVVWHLGNRSGYYMKLIEYPCVFNKQPKNEIVQQTKDDWDDH